MVKDLDIVIVNWNSGNYLRQCLSSIQSADKDKLDISQVVIVDNASVDGSAERLDDIDLPLTIICNRENTGFAAACNKGAENCSSEYLLFLNPDVRLHKDSLTIPIEYLEKPENKKVGVAGIQLVDSNGNIARSCTRFPTAKMFINGMLGLDKLLPGIFYSHFMNEWHHRESRVVDHVIGAFYLVRRSLFEKLSGFDEQFFVYLEDLDFSFRLHQSGYFSRYLVETQAFHQGGGTSDQIRPERLFYSLRSHILYAYKHFRWTTATFLLFMRLFVEPFTRIGGSILKGSMSQLKDTVNSYYILFSNLTDIVKQIKKC